jgi:glycosyltransferase involved in cell wall biosynthesis
LAGWFNQNLASFQFVVLHGLWQYPSVAVVRALKRITDAPPKFYVMPHGMLGPWFQRDKTRRLKAWRNWAYWKLLQKHAIQRADAILFSSETEQLLARQTFSPYKPKRELMVGLGVEGPPQFDSSMREAFDSVCPAVKGKNFLLFVGRIDIIKGIDNLIDAYADVASREHSSGKHIMPLVIAGPLNRPYAIAMQELAKQRNLLRDNDVDAMGKPAIYFPGMLQGGAKWGAFDGCDAFVLPSHHESFGIAVVEAIACGKPALITDQVSIANDLEQDGAALVGPDTMDGMRKLIDQWCTLSADSKNAMSLCSRNSYLKRYLPSHAAECMLDAIGYSNIAVQH